MPGLRCFTAYLLIFGSPFDAFILPNESTPQAGRSGSAFLRKDCPRGSRFRKLPSVLHAARSLVLGKSIELSGEPHQRFVSRADVSWRMNTGQALPTFAFKILA